MDERCFICDTRIGRGNLPTIGAHERMNKLVSVSQTVEHSSTIISDILSRILNETVMHEETICRICFQLLNDIDYHLKEAQEKTDEITNKFLDKGKDPLSYKPQPIVTGAKSEDEDEISPRVRKVGSKKRNPPSMSAPASEDDPLATEDDPLATEDEMSVNSINKNKAKLLSHVLNPKIKSKSHKTSLESEASRTDETDEEPRSKRRRKESSKKSRRHRRYSSDEEAADEGIDSESNRLNSSMDTSDLATVNLSDLSGTMDKESHQMYFATRSDPNAAAKRTGGLISASKSVSCPKCSKIFKKKSNLQLHIEKVHVEQAPVYASQEPPETHKCHLCPREFTNARSLAKHKEEHKSPTSGQSLSPSSIPEATKRTPASTSKDSSEAKAICPICKKTFQRKFNMRIHIDRVHNKVKPFPCKSCDKSFATNSDLKQHMTVHGEGKTFECEECGRTFTNRDSIILHRKQHTKQHTHFCVLCMKGFYKASCLSRHMRTHTGERPYKCDLCNKGFSQSSTLKIHKDKCSKGRSMDPEELLGI